MHPFEEASTESTTGVTTKVAAVLVNSKLYCYLLAISGQFGMCHFATQLHLENVWCDLSLDDHDLSQSWRHARKSGFRGALSPRETQLRSEFDDISSAPHWKASGF